MRRLTLAVSMVLIIAACSGSGSTDTSAPGGTASTVANTSTTSLGGASTTSASATTPTTEPAAPTTTTTLPATTTTAATTTVPASTTSTTTAESTTTTAGATTTTIPAVANSLELEGVTYSLEVVCSGTSEEGTVYRGASLAGEGLAVFVFEGQVDSVEVFTPGGTYAGDGDGFVTQTADSRFLGQGNVFSDNPDEVDPVPATFDIPAQPGACPGLRGDGLSVADFGMGGDETVAALRGLLGPPVEDTGWLDAADLGCKGSDVRFVAWEDGFVLLTDADTAYGPAGTRHFAFYGAPEGTAFASADGIQPGVTTLGEVPGADPQFDEVYELFIFEVDGVIYEVETVDPSALIIFASAGDVTICGE